MLPNNELYNIFTISVILESNLQAYSAGVDSRKEYFKWRYVDEENWNGFYNGDYFKLLCNLTPFHGNSSGRRQPTQGYINPNVRWTISLSVKFSLEFWFQVLGCTSIPTGDLCLSDPWPQTNKYLTIMPIILVCIVNGCDALQERDSGRDSHVKNLRLAARVLHSRNGWPLPAAALSVQRVKLESRTYGTAWL